MKSSVKLFFFLLISLGFTAGTMYAQSDKSTKAKAPVTIKDGGVYKFTATYVYPLSGRSKYLTSPYDVTFSKDSLNGHLPYFGVASSVPYGSSDGGVTFQTSKITFEESIDKKGKYKVHYKIKESSDVLDATFIIYKDGTADLQLTFMQRQGISYRGNITKVQTKG